MAKESKKAVSQVSDKVPAKVEPYSSPFEEMERMMESFFGRGSWLSPFQHYHPSWPQMKSPFEGRTPKVDVIDRDKEVVVKAELPGVKKDDLEVNIIDNRLTIKASTKHEEEKEEGEYHRRELSSGSFVRTLMLPADVDGAKAKALFKDGMLELTLPKQAEAKRHNVKIE